MDIVERIKAKSKEKGTNIATLEKELGIGNGVIRRWNERKPGAEQVYKIAVCLNTTVEWLLTGKSTNENFTKEEKSIIAAYRKADPAEQGVIKKILDIQEQEEKLSQSKIG